MLTPKDIAAFARRSGVDHIAVEDYLSNIYQNKCFATAIATFMKDALVHEEWNDATLTALQEGIIRAYDGECTVDCPDHCRLEEQLNNIHIAPTKRNTHILTIIKKILERELKIHPTHENAKPSNDYEDGWEVIGEFSMPLTQDFLKALLGDNESEPRKEPEPDPNASKRKKIPIEWMD